MSNVRLSDLTAIVLQECLDKNTPLHTSESWENQVLTSEQVSYAAKDAYASLVIYNKLADHYIVPAPIPATSPPLTPVLLYSSSLNHVIAEGHLSILYPHLQELHDDIEILHGHALVDIHHIVVPRAIILAHHKQCLESFSELPFTLVCDCNHIYLYSPQPLSTLSQPSAEIGEHGLSTASNTLVVPSQSLNVHASDGFTPGVENDSGEMISIGKSLESTNVSGPEEEYPSPSSNESILRP
jgi:hypothetical protein